jgi:hypothetical protein
MGFHVTRDGRRQIQSPFHYKGEKETVIHVAMNNKQGAECVSALIEFGADVNTRTSNNVTPLQHCLEYGNLKIMFEVFSILLKAGADTNALLESGRTIVHVVAAMGHRELIRQLLDIGTDCSTKDLFQQTPLELAIRYGHIETAELLESKYGPPVPRKISNNSSPSFNTQDILSPSGDFSIPSISLQDYGSSSQAPIVTEDDYPPAPAQPSQPQFTSFENFEWNQVVNPEEPKKSKHRRSISNFLKKMKPTS